jgi:hypothetical protein
MKTVIISIVCAGSVLVLGYLFWRPKPPENPDHSTTGSSAAQAPDSATRGDSKSKQSSETTASEPASASSGSQPPVTPSPSPPNATPSGSNPRQNAALSATQMEKELTRRYDEQVETKIRGLTSRLQLSPDQTTRLRSLFEKGKQRLGAKGIDPSLVNEFTIGIEDMLNEAQKEEFKKYKAVSMSERGTIVSKALVQNYGSQLQLTEQQKIQVEAALYRWFYDMAMNNSKQPQTDAIAPFLTDEQRKILEKK